MLKKAPYILIIIALVTFVYSCSKKTKQELKKSEVFANGKPVVDYEIEENEKFATVEVYEKIKPYLEAISKQYDSVSYFCDLDTNYLFYVQNGNRKGVVNKEGKILIPLVYSKIYSPGGTVKGLIEVEKGDERGLYDFSGNLAVPVKYQSIYPVNYDDVLVQVRLGNQYGVVTKEGNEVFDTTGLVDDEFFKSPYLNKKAQDWKFDVNAEHILFLQPVDYVRYQNDVIDGRAVVITPSYLMELDFYPEKIQGIIMETNADFGVAESKAEVKEVKSLWGNIVAAFTEYYEIGLDARGYETEKNNLITVNEKGEIVSKVEFYQPYIPFSPCGKDKKVFSTRFIDSSLFEVKSYAYFGGRNTKDTNYYDAHDEYFYYRIKPNGKIEKLETNRRYAFTKYVAINESYLKGCFSSLINNEYGAQNNAKVRENLSLEDVLVMKNEIYADYGYIFTDAKWRDYFKKKQWYKAELSDIEPILAEADRHNLAFINTIIEDMQANPDAYNETSKGTIALYP